MKTKFNIEDYRNSLNNQIADAQARLDYLKALPRVAMRYAVLREIQDLKDFINKQRLMLNPQFMCEYCYSDRHAYQVIRLESDKKMVVRRLDATRVNVGENCMSDRQEYEFTENPYSPEFTLRLHKDGRWYDTKGCNPFGVTEEPYEYFDFGF